MRINSVNSLPFRATLKGDFSKVMNISLDGNLPTAVADKTVNKIHRLCPNDEDKVYFYFKKYENEDKNKESVIRCGVKISIGDLILEKNVDPSGISQKGLLCQMTEVLKQLLKGKINPDSTVELYTVPKTGWLADFKDVDTKYQAVTPLF